MKSLKEVPTDQLVAELLSRDETKKAMPRQYFVRCLIRYEMALIKRSERNVRSCMPFNDKLSSTVIELARVLLDD